GSGPDSGSPSTSGAAGTGTDVPSTGAAGTGTDVPSTGAAGTDSVGTGFAGTDGPATGFGGSVGTGAGGSTPTTTRTVTPLRISGKEAISRVTNVLWQDVPSADLFSQADLGHFKTTDDLYGAIRQVLADPRARTGLAAFYRWWLKLDQLPDAKK